MTSGYWACFHDGDSVRTGLTVDEMRDAVRSEAGTLWVDIDIREPDAVAILSDVFHFHPLAIEDCLNPNSRVKIEEYSHFLILIVRTIAFVEHTEDPYDIETVNLNCFLGKNFLVTYHNVPIKSVAVTEEQATRGAMHIARAPDRVAYNLLDSIVDNYKPALDELALKVGELEQEALQEPSKNTLNEILRVKKEVMHLRQIIGPQREVIARFARGEFKQIRPHMVPYYKDVYDALFQISEMAQSYTHSLTGILQVYLNMSSNQTGEVVKLLTVITLITTPLTLIGTWYGMNFKHMPELEWVHGYWFVGALTIGTTALTYWYFKKQKWF